MSSDLPGWVINWILLPTALSGNIFGVICTFVGILMFIYQFKQIINREFTVVTDDKLKEIGITVPASIAVIGIGIITLYFFTVGRTIEFTVERNSLDFCSGPQTVKFGSFGGEDNQTIRNLIRGFNDMLASNDPDTIRSRGIYIARQISTDDARPASTLLRDYLVFKTLDDEQKGLFCDVYSQARKPSDFTAEEAKLYEPVAKLLSEGIPQ
jgi:hypothetical protein